MTRPQLGQHFLIDPQYRRRIIEGLALRPDDLVIEIGPGRGDMTDLLAARTGKVVAVELDPNLVRDLQEKFRNHPKIEIIPGDILATNLNDICRRHQAEKCFLFGNLPYYITSPILHHVLDFAESIRSMALMVQQEVADRLVARPGCRAYGYLTVFVQLHSCPRTVLRIPPGAFSPQPKVQSALVTFQMQSGSEDLRRGRRTEFLSFVKQCFRQKRKKLVNNLSSACPRGVVEKALESLELPEDVRAEQLSLHQFSGLFEQLQRKATPANQGE